MPHAPISPAKKAAALQDFVPPLKPPVLPPPSEFGSPRLLLGQRFGRAVRQDRVSPATQLIGMDVQLLGNFEMNRLL